MKANMKKIALALLIVALLVASVGCISSTGSFHTTSCVSKQTSRAFSMKYSGFDGNKTYTFTVKDDATLNVRFVSEEGKLSCRITGEDGTEYYRCDDVQTEELTIPLGGKGKYTVELCAEGHKGAFYFSW